MNKIVMVIMELALTAIVWKVASACFYKPISAIISFVDDADTVYFKYNARQIWKKALPCLTPIVLIVNMAIFYLLMRTPFVTAAFQFITNYFS